MQLFYGQGTDIGKKKLSNQDRLLIKIGQAEGPKEFGLFAIADGMGGLDEGERASTVAVKTLKDWWEGLVNRGFFNMDSFSKEEISLELQKQFNDINSQIRRYSFYKGIKSGTTLSSLFISERDYVFCHIGDSRIYKVNVRKKELKQLTMDHTYVADQVRRGIISPEEGLKHPKKNMLTQCLGRREHIAPSLGRGKIKEGDLFLVCSDGLYNRVSHSVLVETVTAGIQQEMAPELIVKQLLHLANEGGGNDNISVILVGSNFNIFRNVSDFFSLKRGFLNKIRLFFLNLNCY